MQGSDEEDEMKKMAKLALGHCVSNQVLSLTLDNMLFFFFFSFSFFLWGTMEEVNALMDICIQE